MQYVDLPIVGLDDDGLIAFVNAATERLFVSRGPLVGVELSDALPALGRAIASSVEGANGELLISHTKYFVKWNTLGAGSRSPGRLVTLSRFEVSPLAAQKFNWSSYMPKQLTLFYGITREPC